MGNYYNHVKYLISHITHNEIIDIPLISEKTIELGTKYSPDFVCMPFKYTIGTIIEGLELGGNVIIQFGGGCRYGYYSELQTQILKDLNYNFKFINLVDKGKLNIKKIYKETKFLKINYLKFIHYFLITRYMIKYTDKLEDYKRMNMNFIKENKFEKLEKSMYEEFSKVKCLFGLKKIYNKYLKLYKNIKVDKKNKLKIGIIGELYTLMEPFSNKNIEKMENVEIKRFTNVDYLLFTKKKLLKKALKDIKEYNSYKLSSDASINIYWMKHLCMDNYDGIIHIKSSFCTPEIGIMPILDKISKTYDIPIMYLSFDSNTTIEGIKTRIEAFKDMLEMRKK